MYGKEDAYFFNNCLTSKDVYTFSYLILKP